MDQDFFDRLPPDVKEATLAKQRQQEAQAGRSTGVPPVHEPPTAAHPAKIRETNGQDAHAAVVKQGAYLPHWTRVGAIYAVTFRLKDSLPRAVLDAWLAERQCIVRTAAQMGRPLSNQEEKRLRELHSQRIESYLDAGRGKCWLRQGDVANLVAKALRHFDGQRYQLHAWCVMPNHVHVIVEPIANRKLSAILHSWKSYTAKEVNRLLKRTGTFWQEEYYDT